MDDSREIPLDTPYWVRPQVGRVEGISHCCSALRNINFKHLNRDTSGVPPRRAQLATLDQACHRSSRIKEEEETHQLFNKRVASLVYHLSHFPSVCHVAHAAVVCQHNRAREFKKMTALHTPHWRSLEVRWKKIRHKFFFCNFILIIAFTFETRPIFNAQQLWLN